MQQLLMLIASIITVVAMLSELLTLGNQFVHDVAGTSATTSSTVTHDPVVPINPDRPLVIAEGQTILVNGISFDMTLDEISRFTPDFPTTSHPVYTEKGEKRQQYEYRHASYLFDGLQLEEILIDKTPENIGPGSHLSDVTAAYGRPVHAYKSNNGLYYVAYKAAPIADLAWLFTFRFSSKTITSVALVRGLNQFINDEKASHRH